MTDLASRSAPAVGFPAALTAAPAPPLWLVAAHADVCGVDDRAAFAERARDRAPDGALLVTCHRAEVYGTGSPGDAATLMAIGDGLSGELRVLTGEAVVRHAFRLAAGLESAVIGEDQVLNQVRGLRESLRAKPLDPYLSRLFETAIAVGRKARSARASGSGRTLAARALDWLSLDAAVRRGDRVLVAGAGTMGRLLVREAARRDLSVTVASRSVERALAVAAPHGLDAVDLRDGARLVHEGAFAALAVALAGPWIELDGAALPPAVDLSSPAAIPARRSGDGPRLDIDGLFLWEGLADQGQRREYAVSASAVVEEATATYLRWAAGRSSLDTLQALRGRVEQERREQLDRLMRRLPDLATRERALLEAYSEQLVAAVLHEPTAKLRDDLDGSAAEAARRLFDL